MKDLKHLDFNFPKKEAKLPKKYKKPWTQKIHNRFIKEMGISEEEHEAWHRQYQMGK